MKTTTHPLPAIVTHYFTAANQHDADRAAACFATDATVHDENHAYTGPDAIRGWVAETSRKYQPAFTLMRASAHGDEVTLAVAIAGQFPGSPVTLDYDIRLRGRENLRPHHRLNSTPMIFTALVFAALVLFSAWDNDESARGQ